MEAPACPLLCIRGSLTRGCLARRPSKAPAPPGGVDVSAADEMRRFPALERDAPSDGRERSGLLQLARCLSGCRLSNGRMEGWFDAFGPACRRPALCPGLIR
jgi:hypothetical protein